MGWLLTDLREEEVAVKCVRPNITRRPARMSTLYVSKVVEMSAIDLPNSLLPKLILFTASKPLLMHRQLNQKIG